MGRVASRRGRFAEMFVPSFDSTLVIVITILVSGVIAGSLEFMTHLAVAHMQTPLASHALLDASVIALMTMALVAAGIATVRAKRLAVIRQLRTVEELNHHLRNALQVIAQNHYLPEDKRAQAMFDSMDRIDDVLRRFGCDTPSQLERRP
jgi:hypothetical protein